MNDTQKNKILANEPTRWSEKIVNPKRNWKILIILFAVFIVASLGFDFYMYKKIASGDMYIDVTREELTIENLKSDDLKKILDNFETKKATITTIKLENMIDPSI